MRVALAFSILVLLSLACTQAVQLPTATALPTDTEIPVPTLKAVKPTLTASVWIATVSRPQINVRSAGCDENGDNCGEVVGQLESGDQVSIIACDENWCQIEKPAGWVFRGCLSDNPEKLGCSAK